MTEYTLNVIIPNAENKKVIYSVNLTGSYKSHPEDFFRNQENRQNLRQAIEEQSFRQVSEAHLDQIIEEWINDIQLGYQPTTITLDLPPSSSPTSEPTSTKTPPIQPPITGLTSLPSSANYAIPKSMPKISKEELLNSYRAGERNFRRAELEKAADLEGVTLCKVNLMYASLYRANLCQADLHGAKLSGTVLVEAALSGADLSTADLSRAYLCEANLQGANLQGANLCEANLQGANLQGANLQTALYNKQTQFPPDFDPSQAGMSLLVVPPPTPSPDFSRHL